MRHQPFWVVLFALFLFASPTYAGKVLKTSGKKVYVIFSPEEEGTFANNDIFYVTDINGKKTGLLQLKKVQGFKAVGVLGKGKAKRGDLTVFKGAGKKSASSKKSKSSVADSSDSDSGTKRRRRNRMATKWGVVLGYASATQDVKQDATTSSQSGSSLGLRGAYIYPTSESLDIQLLAGLENFDVSGSGKTPESNYQTIGTIGTKITYLSLDALLRYEVFGGESFGIKLLAGAGIFHPMSSTSTAIASIDTVAVGEFGASLEYRTSSMTIPIDFIYYYYPSGGDVSTSLMGLRIGYLF